ncbi:MAG TPA: tetratricopeptide repeat protein [Spirochaetia bacterium]|nr:tetratricopeptide repeat protein [Spirochaetia bacterium]
MGSGRTADTAAGSKRLLSAGSSLPVIVCLVSAFFATGTVWGQIALNVSQPTVPAGGQFTVSFVVQAATVDTLTVDEPEYPGAIQKTGGPLLRPAVAGEQSYSARSESSVEVQFSFSALRPGRFIIGPFTCRVLGTGGPARTLSTDQAVVAVTDPSHANSVPPAVQWVVSTRHPYIGQTVFLQLTLANIPEPLLPERVSAPAPAGGVFEEVRGLGRIKSDRYGSTELFRLPIATYFFTPTAAGSVTLPAASVTVNGMTVSSSTVDMQVDPLPAGIESSGAVGAFSFGASVADPEITEGDSFDITLRVEGTGNLSYFKFPEVVVPGMVVTSTSERNRYVPTELGYTGYREVMYQLSPRTPGVMTVHVPIFRWLDPTTGRTHEAGPESFTLTTDPAAISAAPGETASTDGVFSLLSAEQVRAMEPLDAYRDALNYLAFLPGILILVAAFFLRRRRDRRSVLPIVGSVVLFIAATAAVPFPEAEIQKGLAAFKAGQVDEAVQLFETALQLRPDSPGILYDLGLCDFQAGRHAEAVYAVVSAIRFRPGDGLLRRSLVWMESRLSLTRQIEPARSLGPDLMLIITAILFNLTCVLIAVSGKDHGGRFVIAVVFAVLLSFASAGGLIYSIQTQRTELGVVGRNAGSLLKIPRPDASRWIELPAGTTVRVLLDSNGFYLIRTGYGVEGWIHSDDLLYHVLPAGPRS